MSDAVGSGQLAVGSVSGLQGAVRCNADFQPLVPKRETLGAILEQTERRKPSDDLCETFVGALAGKGWVTARELRDATGIDDRVLRMCAEASEGRVISGQKGYKLTAEATPGEIHHACAWLLSQAQRMTDRARQIRVAQHRTPQNSNIKTGNEASGVRPSGDGRDVCHLSVFPTEGDSGPRRGTITP